MMSVIRIIIAAIISIIIAVLLNKFTKIRKQYISLLTFAVVIVVSTVLNFIPFENAFMTFSTPEESFNYCYGKRIEVQLVLDGEESSLVVGAKDGKYTIQIVPQKDGGWKLGRGIDTELTSNEVSDGIVVNVYRYKDTQDYFVSVVNTSGGGTQISDSCNSKFHWLSYKESFYDGRTTTYYTDIKSYYAYVENFDEQYYITVNGNDIYLNKTETPFI